MQRNHIVKINLNEPLLRSNAGEILATDDRQGNRFGALLHRDGKAVDASGYAVTGYFIRPNGDTVINEGTAQGNLVYVDLAPECYAHEGVFSLAIKVNGPSITSTIRVIDGYVRLTKTDRQIAPEGLLPDLEELLGQIAAMENAYAKGAVSMIDKLTTPFTVTGESVSCYPVENYPLKVATRFYPSQQGKGDATPSNIRPIQPETELLFFHDANGNHKTHTLQLNAPSYGGIYGWESGSIAEMGKYKILNGQELGSDGAGWRLQSGTETAQRYFFLNIAERKSLDAPDNVEENRAIMSHFTNHPEIRTSNTVQGFRFYNVRDGFTPHARLVVRPNMADFMGADDAETLQNWKAWLASQEAQGKPVEIAYQMAFGVGEKKKEYQGIEILSGKGENRFQNNWRGDILTVSGPLDPAHQDEQQDERISDLEEGAVSGGGSYTLPIASAETLGGVKVGDGLQVDAEGKVSVKPDGDYEPIKTVTTKEGEDVATVAFDVSGYKKIKLIAKIPKATSAKAGVWIANGPMGYSSEIKSASNDRQFSIEFILRDGAIFLGNYGGGLGEETSLMYDGAVVPYPAGMWGFPADSISRIEVKVLGGETFPANSEFSIEGVRA